MHVLKSETLIYIFTYYGNYILGYVIKKCKNPGFTWCTICYTECLLYTMTCYSWKTSINDLNDHDFSVLLIVMTFSCFLFAKCYKYYRIVILYLYNYDLWKLCMAESRISARGCPFEWIRPSDSPRPLAIRFIGNLKLWLKMGYK